jgi:hypothetical protein
MQKTVKLLMLLFLWSFVLTRPGYSQKSAVGVALGHNGGPGIKVNGLISDFAEGFPLAVKLGIGYTSVDPGNAAEARSIFINDATNGTPEQSGWVWDFRADLLYKLKWFAPAQTFLYAGIRYASFTGNFKYIGGNEDFDVTSAPWGFGTGMEIYFRISKRIDLVTTAGIDYYLDSDLTGHDTVYSPDGENINSRLDYTYQDADDAINQPGLNLLVLIGLSYRFR